MRLRLVNKLRFSRCNRLLRVVRSNGVDTPGNKQYFISYLESGHNTVNNINICHG